MPNVNKAKSGPFYKTHLSGKEAGSFESVNKTKSTALFRCNVSLKGIVQSMLVATHENEGNSSRWFRVWQDFHIIKESGGHQGGG